MNKLKGFLLVITIVFASLFLFINFRKPGNMKKIILGIYAGPGAYEDDVNYLTNFAIREGMKYRLLYEKDIVEGVLSDIEILIIPGGWAGRIDEFGRKGYGSMSEDAINKIRQFVEDGGAYFGICAGAYFASKYVLWEGTLYRNKLALFDGVSIGPIEDIAPWPLTNWTKIEIGTSLGVNFSEIVSFYWGGPYFYSNVTNFITLERYKINGKSATILFTYGKGKVILTGLHHEWINYQNKDIQEKNWIVLKKIILMLLEK